MGFWPSIRHKFDPELDLKSNNKVNITLSWYCVCVCVSFWWFRLYNYSYISQDDGAGGSLRRWEGWVKKGVNNYRMGERRQAARQGSLAQLPLAYGLVFTSMDRSGGRRQADLAYSANRKGVKEPWPFQLSLGVGRLLSLWDWTLCVIWSGWQEHRSGLWPLMGLRHHTLSSFLRALKKGSVT